LFPGLSLPSRIRRKVWTANLPMRYLGWPIVVRADTYERDSNVVHADDRDVLRHTQAMSAYGVQSAQRDNVVESEDRVGRSPAGKSSNALIA